MGTCYINDCILFWFKWLKRKSWLGLWGNIRKDQFSVVICWLFTVRPHAGKENLLSDKKFRDSEVEKVWLLLPSCLSEIFWLKPICVRKCRDVHVMIDGVEPVFIVNIRDIYLLLYLLPSLSPKSIVIVLLVYSLSLNLHSFGLVIVHWRSGALMVSQRTQRSQLIWKQEVLSLPMIKTSILWLLLVTIA